MLFKKPFFILFSCVVLLQISCASKGFNRSKMSEELSVAKPSFDDKAIKDAFLKKPNLPKKFRLAVYFTPPRHNDWRWTEQDKNTLDTVIAELKAKGRVSEVFPLVDSVVISDDLKSLRLVAAKHQADALLVVNGAGEIDRYINKWGWSYALLLPTFFIRGSDADTLFVVNAALWDVKNEYLYLTAQTEAELKHKYIAAFGKSDKELLREAKTEALTNLKREIEKNLLGIRFDSN